MARSLTILSVAASVVLASCSDSVTGGGTGLEDVVCGALDPIFLADGGVGRDGIPALTDPPLVPTQPSVATAYIPDDSRVIGVFLGDEAIAIPHQLMYRHEIVNLNRIGGQVAVTYCPLTGSALAFDRASVGGAEFGVSGLLYQANLIVYDRNQPNESLWPQMAGRAACGPRADEVLKRHAVVEATWEGWRAMHPGSRVVGVADASDIDFYGINPYGAGYEVASNGDFLGFPIPRTDSRRQPKERVLGLPAEGGANAIAFPFGSLWAAGDHLVHEFEYGGEPAVVFWDSAKQAAAALRPVTASGQHLTFRVEDDGIWDNETNSRWTVTGHGVVGPSNQERLELIPEAYVAFWLPWVAFNGPTDLAIE